MRGLFGASRPAESISVEHRLPVRVDVQVDRVGFVDAHRGNAFPAERVDHVGGDLGRPCKRDEADARVAAVVGGPTQREAGDGADALREPRLVRAHALEQPVEPGELDPSDRSLDLRGAEVEAGVVRQADTAADGAGAVVDVDRDVEQVLPVRDHDTALAGGDESC